MEWTGVTYNTIQYNTEPRHLQEQLNSTQQRDRTTQPLIYYSCGQKISAKRDRVLSGNPPTYNERVWGFFGVWVSGQTDGLNTVGVLCCAVLCFAADWHSRPGVVGAEAYLYQTHFHSTLPTLPLIYRVQR